MKSVKTCEYCGNEFTGQPKQRFCKTSHRVMANRIKHDLPATPAWSKKQVISEGELSEVKRAYQDQLHAEQERYANLDNRYREVLQKLTQLKRENRELNIRAFDAETDLGKLKRDLELMGPKYFDMIRSTPADVVKEVKPPVTSKPVPEDVKEPVKEKWTGYTEDLFKIAKRKPSTKK